MAGNLPQHGEPVLLKDLHSSKTSLEALEGKSIRINGRLVEHNVCNCEARITDMKNTHSLWVDTRLIEPFSAVTGSLFQFIGELDCQKDRHSIILKARVVRCVDTLDLTMYEMALELQRDYLKKRALSSTQSSPCFTEWKCQN